jgi:hypothetical protein
VEGPGRGGEDSKGDKTTLLMDEERRALTDWRAGW